MKARLVGFAMALVILAASVRAELPADNVIVAFDNAAQDDIRTAGVQNQISAKLYALVHVAQYLAVVNASGLGEVEKAGRAAYAGHAVLNILFPWRFFKHDAAIGPYAAALTPEQRSAAQAAGRAIATSVVGAHLGDGLSDYVQFTPSPANGPAGAYQFTPNQTYVLYPQLATTKPFVITNVSAFDQGPPLALTSAQYSTELAEVFTLGVKNSSARTQQQTDTACFWADGATTSAITGHFNTIAQKVLPATLSLEAVAETFAKANVAAFDASIAGWAVKYKYLFWRPITAIRQGDGAASNAAYVKADWTPELSTPPHPEYASGHQYSAAAIASVLAAQLGTDAAAFTVGTEFPGLAPRSYTSLSQAVDEVGNSRILAGVHFRRSIDAGNQLGRDVAASVVANWSKANLLTGVPAAPPALPPPSPRQPPSPRRTPPNNRPSPKRRPPPKSRRTPPNKRPST